MISFRSISLSNASDIQAAGGNGGPYVGGANGGGGAGGGGGYMRIAYAAITAAAGSLNAATMCPGGTGGTGHGTGANGAAGSAGTLELVATS
jgi:hypothetical protein